MCRLLLVALVWFLAGCGRQDLIQRAEADFRVRNPHSRIVKAYLGEGDANHAYVHIRYIHTSASPPPAEPGIMEMEMGYKKTENGWTLFDEAGSRYMRPPGTTSKQ